jgi:amino acid adenylation domain-containing protein
LLEQISGECAHGLFEEQVRRNPEAQALAFNDVIWTYEELNQAANRLARHLQKLGTRPEVVVGLFLDRVPDAIISILAVLKAGGAYIYLDQSHPQQRLEFMTRDAQVAVIITHSSKMERAGAFGQIVTQLDVDQPQIDRESKENLEPMVDPENAAYLIYTSGSTGSPKGTVGLHHSVCNLARGLCRSFYIEPAHRILQFAPGSFDAFVAEWAKALLNGACLVLPDPQSLLVGPDLLALLERHRINVVTLPPSVLDVLPLAALPDLQRLIVAGEACPAALVQRWSQGRYMINAYGPTEITVCCTASAPLAGNENSTPPIGRPIQNLQTYVLDHAMKPVPVGVPGELYVGGAGVTRGYLNRPDLTASRFVPNPFGAAGSRLYRTGDKVKWLPDKNLEFLGRMDQQVKIRGLRIEVGEIESRLLACRGVRQAAVHACDSPHGGKEIIAFVVSNEQPADGRSIPQFWPSVAEYFVYDELLYLAMVNDTRRNDAYRTALKQHVEGKVVVDVGTGPEALLARMCVECGAARVYAIEQLEETYEKAAHRIRGLGLAGTITLLKGDARDLVLPEPADLCVSELVGPIASLEGAVPILNAARRFLKPDGILVPLRCMTKIAAVSLPAELRSNPVFGDTPRYYAQKIFEHVGRRFDLRLCVRNLPPSSLLSTAGVFEDLDFGNSSSGVPLEPEYSHQIDLVIQRQGWMDGFLLWLNLVAAAGIEIDILQNEHCWLPVYVPAFHPRLEVDAGDRIVATCETKLSANGLNPDYEIAGAVVRLNGDRISFAVKSSHASLEYMNSPTHRSLLTAFQEDGNKPVGAARSVLSLEEDLRAQMSVHLPEYMIPGKFVQLAEMPLNANGKVDRSRLSALAQGNNSDSVFAPCGNELEKSIEAIWCEFLGRDRVGVRSNFFELGGHSVLLAKIAVRIREKTGMEVPLVEMIRHPTIASLAGYLSRLDGPGDAAGKGRTRGQARRALRDKKRRPDHPA